MRVALDFIRKLLAPYAVPASSSARGIATLKHEPFNASVKLDSVVKSLFCERDEIFARSRRLVAMQLDVQITKVCV